MIHSDKYTLVFARSPNGAEILLGSPIDGNQAAIDATIAEHREMERENRMGCDEFDPERYAPGAEIRLVSGCILTDEEPEDETRIVYAGHELGWLFDADGQTYTYAVK